MTTLNGLPRTWDSFIQGNCARKKLVKFSKLWEECSQEEAQIVAREDKMKLSEFNPREAEEKLITSKVRILIVEITIERTHLD